jgi:cytochrome c553
MRPDGERRVPCAADAAAIPPRRAMALLHAFAAFAPVLAHRPRLLGDPGRGHDAGENPRATSPCAITACMPSRILPSLLDWRPLAWLPIAWMPLAWLPSTAAFAQAAPAPAQAPLEVQVPDTLAQRTLACTACHGREGRATNQGYFPRIAGKPAGYLYNQLVNFREGRRVNATMTYLVEHLNDAYLREIAGYFGALELPYPPPPAVPGTPQELRRGAALVQQGDPSRRLPACVQCHGRELTGVRPAIPGLLGLPRDYLIAQFGNWRTGHRHAAEPDCMAQITQRLAPDDIAAIAGWLASQPVLQPALPAASAAQPLPMQCGSGLR